LLPLWAENHQDASGTIGTFSQSQFVHEGIIRIHQTWGQGKKKYFFLVSKPRRYTPQPPQPFSDFKLFHQNFKTMKTEKTFKAALERVNTSKEENFPSAFVQEGKPHVKGISLDGVQKDENGYYTLDIDGTSIKTKMLRGVPDNLPAYDLVEAKLVRDITNQKGEVTLKKGYLTFRLTAAAA
jgi:hypothetical protein